RLTQRSNGRGGRLSAGTVNNVMVQLDWAFNQARRTGLTTVNPCANVPKLPDDHESRFLTDREVECLVHKLLLPEDARLVEFIAETGLRKGEVLALTLQQVDAAP